MNVKRKREEKALNELRSSHSYLLYELSQRNERSTMLFKQSGGKRILRPAVCLKLVVPADSVLGAEVIAMRKAAHRKTRRRELAKARKRGSS